MRIYQNAYELMSEMSRDLWEMGVENRPKMMQNKVVEGNEDFITKELICEQYCLMGLDDPDTLFVFNQAREWAEAEFLERIDEQGTFINPGKAWELRKELWSEFINKYGEFDYTYSERMNDCGCIIPLDEVISTLIDDHDTRKAVLAIYSPEDSAYIHSGARRVPCSMYYDFLIRPDVKGEDQVNICYHQRSSDFVTFFGSDVFLAWKLMEYVADKVGVKPGYLYHTIDSLHCYKKDWVKLKSGISSYFTER